MNLYIADKYADTLGEFEVDKLNADANSVTYTGEGIVEENNVYEILTSLEKTKYKDDVTIVNGKIALNESVDTQIKVWATEAINGVGNTTIPITPTTDTPVIAVDTIVTTTNASITGEKFAFNNPVIPVGFKAVETAKATWTDGEDEDVYPDGWNNGLVIQDGSGNEYVWIPVDGTNVTYEKWNGSKNTEYTVTKEQVEDDTLPSGVTSETDQITKYGGFYIARYEAGLPDEQTTEKLMATKTFSETDNKTTIGKAQSKADKIVWNRINYNNAKIVSENVVSTNYVQSGLITGTQWDTMLKFLAQKVDVDMDCRAWGNYYDKYGYTINGYYRTQNEDVVYTKGKYTKSANGYLLLQTGKFGSIVTEGSPKNLFDVAGNVWEWTAETVTKKGGTNTTVGNKIFRGGCCSYGGSDNVASFRDGYSAAAITGPDIGFRFVLYIK